MDMYGQGGMSGMNNPYLANGRGYSMPSPKMEVIKVNGQNGVNMFRMPPSSSALLLDENEPIVWLVQTDGAGYKTSTPYKIIPFEPEKPVDVKSLEERIANLERMVLEYESNVATAEERDTAVNRQNESGKRNGKQTQGNAESKRNAELHG